MISRFGGADESIGDREAFATPQLGYSNLVRQNRRNHPQGIDDVRRSRGAEKADWLGSAGVRDRMQQARQPGNMVGVRMGDADRTQALEAPPGFTPGDLRALPTIEKREMSIDPNEKAREPAVRQRQHPARPQK
jgi:hypothetical protein